MRREQILDEIWMRSVRIILVEDRRCVTSATEKIDK